MNWVFSTFFSEFFSQYFYHFQVIRISPLIGKTLIGSVSVWRHTWDQSVFFFSLSRSQLRDARSGKCITLDTLLQQSRSFSLYLKDEEIGGIDGEDGKKWGRQLTLPNWQKCPQSCNSGGSCFAIWVSPYFLVMARNLSIPGMFS